MINRSWGSCAMRQRGDERTEMSPGRGCKLQVYKRLFLPHFTGLELRKRGKTTDSVSAQPSWEALHAATSPAALRQSPAEPPSPLCLLAQRGGLPIDVTGASTPGSGHTLSCGWRAEQHSFWTFIVQISGFPEQKWNAMVKHLGKEAAQICFLLLCILIFLLLFFFLITFFFLSQCRFCCCMKGPKQGHEHCLGTKWWILIWFIAAEKLVKEKWFTASGIYTCTSKTQHISSPSTVTAPSRIRLCAIKEHGLEMLDLLHFFISAYFYFLSQANGQIPLLAT